MDVWLTISSGGILGLVALPLPRAPLNTPIDESLPFLIWSFGANIQETPGITASASIGRCLTWIH